jgi:lipopolysaccharide export system protein LptA
VNKALLLFCAFAFAGAAPSFAQSGATKLDKPLTESRLIETIDSIGTGTGAKTPLTVGERTEKPAAAKDDEKKKDFKGTTEIVADTTNFDQKSHQAVFVGNVTVNNPEFKIVCDKLTAFLKNDDKKPQVKPPGAPVPKGKAATPAPAAEGNRKKGGGGLERAIAEAAEGKRVVITQEKVGEDGKPVFYEGRAEKADYNAITGEVVLTGWPEVQQGLNSSVATERSTVMFLNRDGRLRTEGQSKIVIKDSGPDQANAR